MNGDYEKKERSYQQQESFTTREESSSGLEEEVLDWDLCIESPPPKRRGRIKVRLRYAGRSKPLPF